ncbi:MAG: hypothetical protein M1522_07100, partial [Actinobacteria bacterium]|nr:hypothetical protein [Actinomycetota bacterium]
MTSRAGARAGKLRGLVARGIRVSAALMMIGGLGVVGMLLGTRAASAAGLSWSTQASYLAPAENLKAVSCSSASTCFAVGSNAVRGPALYETTDAGAAWVNDTESLPSGVSYLKGVSCTSATSCQAVGGNFSSSTNDAAGVALSYNGTSWTTESLPSGVGTLYAVSCISATSCQAVGYDSSGNPSGPGVALSYNGTSWTSESLPSGVGFLGGVS